LRFAKAHRPQALTKSGLMVGLGERTEEVHELLRDLVSANVDVGTIGQYLQPTRRNRKVAEFVTPAQFEAYRDYGLSAGLKMVFRNFLLVLPLHLDSVCSRAARRYGPVGQLGIVPAFLHPESASSCCLQLSRWTADEKALCDPGCPCTLDRARAHPWNLRLCL